MYVVILRYLNVYDVTLRPQSFTAKSSWVCRDMT